MVDQGFKVHFNALCRDLSKDFLIKRPLRRCTSFPNIEINVNSCYSFIILSNLSKCTVLLDVEGGGGKVQKWESYSTRVIRWSQAIQGATDPETWSECITCQDPSSGL